MRLFINDIPVHILDDGGSPDPGQYNHTVDAATEPVTQAKLINHVWIRSVDEAALDTLLGLLNSKVPTNILSVIISTSDLFSVKKYLRSKFRVVQAAGGLIRKKEKFLMIYRMKKWDLPKGKKEKNEKYRRTAIREVQEECGLKVVELVRPLCETWHTYERKGKQHLKRTDWFLMTGHSSEQLTAQSEEDIDQVRWIDGLGMEELRRDMYPSLQVVLSAWEAARRDRA